MKITKRQLKRIIKEEKRKILEQAPLPGNGLIEEVMQELNLVHEEESRGGGDPSENRWNTIEMSREGIKGDIIWPRLETALPDVWDETISEMADVLFEAIANEWMETDAQGY